MLPALLEAETAAAPPGDVVSGAWQHHKLTFNYFGITTLYTCDGLESQVRQILLHLGARKDAKVRATGCPGPSNSPSRSAFVNVDFYAIAPAADTPGATASGADSIKAHWTPVELSPQRPSFMGDGDCELMQEMKDLITSHFTLRGVEYRTSCTPHSLNIDGFSIKAQALRVLPATVSGATVSGATVSGATVSG
jgi:hypothetical protein